VPVSRDGESVTLTREWVDEAWRSSNRYYVPDESRYPGSVEQFVEAFFKGLVTWRDILTKDGRAQRAAAKALRNEWRQTGRMQLGPTLAGMLHDSGRPSRHTRNLGQAARTSTTFALRRS
jgi:hypothetical protein